MRRSVAGSAIATLLAGALLAVVSLAGGGRAAAVEAASGPSPAVKTRLPNRLTVIVQENPIAPVVAASLFVRVGSRWETDENAGITNLLQLLLVKGTTTRSALEIAEATERLGGSLSASADPDFSELRGTALSRNWTALLELMADIALRPSLPADELEGERRVTLTSLRTRQDQPFSAAFDTLAARLFGGHPYGRPVLGRAESVERLDRAPLLAHYQRYYRAGRMVLSVSGDVSGPAVLAAARRLFAEAPTGDGGSDPVLPRPTAGADRTRVARASAQAQVLMGFLAPPIHHPDYAAMKVLSAALGGGMSGRLFTELRDKQGLAYSTSAQNPSRVDTSFFFAQLGTAPANATKAEEGLAQQIERLRRERLSAGALERARMYLLGQFALDRRTNARLAWYHGWFEVMGVGHDFAERYARAVRAVTVEELHRAANTYLGRPTTVTLGPPTP